MTPTRRLLICLTALAFVTSACGDDGDDPPAAEAPLDATAEAWEGLMAFDRPVLTLWAGNDPGNLGQCATPDRLVTSIAGARNQPHDRLPEASHFLQDDQGTEIATRLVEWYANPG
jgi:haloalkane dehalogenase